MVATPRRRPRAAAEPGGASRPVGDLPDEAEWSVLGARVRWRPVPDDVPGSRAVTRASHARVRVADDTVWLEDAYVRLLVRGTDEVWLDPRPGVPRADVAHYAYGFGASVLLLHADRFPMHASAVRVPTGVVVVAGNSGAGKSTTCLALGARGGSLLVDDVTPLRPVPDGVVVEPFARPAHLLADAAHRLDLGATRPVDAEQIAGPVGKTVLTVDAGEDRSPVRADRLVVLTATDGVGAHPVVRTVTGAERLRRVVRHSNVLGIASFGPRAERYFAWAAAVADRLDMVEVRRDVAVDSLDAVVDVVAAAAR